MMAYEAVGAGNSVTAVDLVFLLNQGKGKFGIWLRGSRALRHHEFSCCYDSPTLLYSGCSAHGEAE
jgi:hypothetical protein